MIIVIDGYNLLKQIYPGTQSDKTKQRLIRELGVYKHQKSDRISEIVLVFDGGHMTHATREISRGIVVMLSGTRSSADQWIIEYIERHRSKEILVITLDREIRNKAQQYGADSLGVYEFYDIVRGCLLENLEESTKALVTGDFEKYHQDDETQTNELLDLLMIEATQSQPFTKDETSHTTSRKSKSDKLSKQERRLGAKLRKIT